MREHFSCNERFSKLELPVTEVQFSRKTSKTRINELLYFTNSISFNEWDTFAN